MLLLRPYQEAAKAAVYDYLRARDDNPCVVIPTAGGKTPVIASLCKDAVSLWGGRVLVLAHVKELLEQTADKLAQVCPELRFGVYSAGLGRRETTHPVIIAGIQSVFRRACELDAFDLVLIDEAHLIPLEGDGMYRQFLAVDSPTEIDSGTGPSSQSMMRSKVSPSTQRTVMDVATASPPWLAMTTASCAESGTGSDDRRFHQAMAFWRA